MTPSARSSGLLAQLPRFSKFDPGADGEGSLDPLGLAAVADRLAERIAPGVRARMRQPRFVTFAAIGALACAPLQEVVSADGTTEYDVAFEWLVVDALVKHRSREDLLGLPGAQKVRRAQTAGDRIHKGNYLNGPRVFGFTGVYRPFATYADVIVKGEPRTPAENLAAAWEQDSGITGFANGMGAGAHLRDAILTAVRGSLDAGESTASRGGKLAKEIAARFGPLDAGPAERRALRGLITDSSSDTRNRLVHRLLQFDAAGMHEPEIAATALAGADPDLRAELQAIIDYETATTAIDDAFHGMLAGGAGRGGRFTEQQAASDEAIVDLAPLVRDRVKRACDSIDELPQTAGATTLQREVLAAETRRVLGEFVEVTTPLDLVRALISTHERVQGDKGKRMWIDPVAGRWLVRGTYGDQAVSRTAETWVHPMRLATLVNFLTETEV